MGNAALHQTLEDLKRRMNEVETQLSAEKPAETGDTSTSEDRLEAMRSEMEQLQDDFIELGLKFDGIEKELKKLKLRQPVRKPAGGK